MNENKIEHDLMVRQLLCLIINKKLTKIHVVEIHGIKEVHFVDNKDKGIHFEYKDK